MIIKHFLYEEKKQKKLFNLFKIIKEKNVLCLGEKPENYTGMFLFWKWLMESWRMLKMDNPLIGDQQQIRENCLAVVLQRLMWAAVNNNQIQIQRE